MRDAKCIALLDAALSIFLIGPMVVFYWRGTWQVMDAYLMPESEGSSAWVSLGVGLLVPLTAYLSQHHLDLYLAQKSPWPVFAVLSRVYTAVYAFGTVSHWRGTWKLLDYYTGTGWQSATVSVVVGLVGLGALRSIVNIGAPPFFVKLDLPERFFVSPTQFRQKSFDVRLDSVPQWAGHFDYGYILDCVFSVVVPESLVVFVWRGGWEILDAVFYPGCDRCTAWLSLAVGYGVTLVAFCVQVPVSHMSLASMGVRKHVIEDIFSVWNFFGALNIWRGVWMTLDAYLLPDDPALSNIITHSMALVITILMYCGNTLIVRGVYHDAELPAGKGCLFDTRYLRTVVVKEERDVQLRMNSADSFEKGKNNEEQLDDEGYL
ncbi:unnamed protein product [Darwinula stevensoni]|uniref:Fuseless n=1 Tax=Darwinula stevensoni TaxID=69355 RepID=A0A7R8X855_9CRUS|nr:unnamed protein product [Darwinula stevensoni]CAG0884064.1 unnamed protein product [Darwinula stevensoni]